MVSALQKIQHKHDTRWLAPAPLWTQFSDTSNAAVRENFQRPTILRFNSDAFMQELMSLMQLHPDRLIEWKAQPETWREPMATPPTRKLLQIEEPLSEIVKSQTRTIKTLNKSKSVPALSASVNPPVVNNRPLKLYQPIHQRFYLVTASLVCRQVGLPDKAVSLEKDQKVKFVVRRMLPKDPDAKVDNPDIFEPDKCEEYAWVLHQGEMKWKKVLEGGNFTEKALLAEEERLPMSSLGYIEDSGRKRKLLSGFIPVSKREAYINAAKILPGEASDGEDENSLSISSREAMAHVFSLQVAGPWKRLLSMRESEKGVVADWLASAPPIASEAGNLEDHIDDINGSNLKDLRERIQTLSWYVLVDMLNFFKDFIPRVYQYIDTGNIPAGASAAEINLINALDTLTLNPASFASYMANCYQTDLKTSVVAALSELAHNPAIEIELDLVEYPYDRAGENSGAEHHWPDFVFPLADPLLNTPLPKLVPPAELSPEEPDRSQDQVDALTNLVKLAIPDDLAKAAPDVTRAKAPQKDGTGGWFVIRCVYESPHCGPFDPPLVSDATVPFKMASLYDPDAPGRPINIPMPLDISPAGLRKHNKNATFMISDMLCGKIRGTRKTTLGDLVLSVLPWPFHKDLPEPSTKSECSKGGIGFGMFCSLSIPIVTLCAMILLIIMVTLFDLFFRWLPLFFLCLPIPGLTGKQK
jgi:hypothetical protein